MEFDTHLAQVQGFLSHANRVSGPLAQLKLDSDYDAIQGILGQLKDFILTIPESELRKCHLFLFLNTNIAVDHKESWEQADWCSSIGIAPTISMDLFLALSVELEPLQEFIFDAMALMPVSIAYEITRTFVDSRYMGISFSKVIKRLPALCSAICHNILTKKQGPLCHNVFIKNEVPFYNFLIRLLERVLFKMQADITDLGTYLVLFKASLSIILICLKEESPFEGSIWEDLYSGSMTVIGERTNDEHAKVLALVVSMSSKFSVEISSKYHEKVKAEMSCLSNDPEKFEAELSDELKSLILELGKLSYECRCFFEKKSSLAHHVPHDLYNILDELAMEPKEVLDEIKDANLPLICTNASLGGENQHLWIKALLSHHNWLRKEEAISALSTLQHMLDSQDDYLICDTVLSGGVSSYNVRRLFMSSLGRLDLSEQISLLNKRLELHGDNEIFDSESNCEADGESECYSEIHILETLNRLVAQEDSHQNTLVELSFKYPRLVVEHILLKAVQNELFSTSVVPGLLERLNCVFTCPLATKSADDSSLNLTEVLISDIMSDRENIEKECEGIQSLVKQLLMKSIVSVEYFLHSCVFPLLYNHSKELSESLLILLLQILLDVQTGIQGWEKYVNLSSMLAFLGQLLEFFTCSPNMDYQALRVRDVIIRNIENIFSLPDCLNSIKDAEKSWLLKELSTLSPINRHYYSALFPGWRLFVEEDRDGIIATLSTVLPLLHISEWFRLRNNIRLHNDDKSNNSELAVIFCSAVSLIVSGCYHRKQGRPNLNYRGSLRNLACVVKSCVTGGIASRHAPRILEELLHILEPFPETEQFELSMFVLPLMLNLIGYGSGNRQLLSDFGHVILASPVYFARLQLGRQLQRLTFNLSMEHI